MIRIFVIISMSLLFSCTNLYTLNNELLKKNMSLVKEMDIPSKYSIEDVTFDGSGHLCEYDKINFEETCMYLPTESFTNLTISLKNINGKDVILSQKDHVILEGDNNLLIECKATNIYKVNFFYKRIHKTQLLKVNLIKGHTYELSPIFVENLKTKNKSCIGILRDTTII